jgi:hypothetical protein
MLRVLIPLNRASYRRRAQIRVERGLAATATQERVVPLPFCWAIVAQQPTSRNRLGALTARNFDE